MRILVSQRRDPVPGRSETRDALDVRWASLLWGLGMLPIPISSGIADTDAYVRSLEPDGVLLSGGNNITESPERDAIESALLRYSMASGTPVLGVCRGMQMINVFLGGTLAQVEGHIAVRHRLFGPEQDGTREVNSYHHQGVVRETIAPGLEILAWSEDQSIESVRHRSLPWVGIMWHPEREAVLDPRDQALLRKHFLSPRSVR
jgi:N5-(cytidine 5'-diphosphoramidyl)-L-glutamine hydrolase